MGRAFRSHPRGESFVQPKIVPPRHRYQITEPLVGDLVGDDFVNTLLRRDRRILRVEQQRCFVVGNSTPILHGAAKSTRDRELIELGQRIWNPEILIVIAQNLRRAL